jgi:sigma-B regulation protein RsbU (phosphoserine phosphatase)
LHGINAGHNYPYIFRKGEKHPIELTKGGIMLGSIDLPFEEETLTLCTDDILVLYTDGVTEAWNNKEDEYGEERLIKLVNTSREMTSKELMDKLLIDLQHHVGDAEPSDDITCIVIKIQN